MDKLKNYAQIRFTNAVLIDIFSHYADNSAMAEFVSADGSVDIRFRVEPPLDPPKNAEQVLSLMFALSHVLESFSDIKMSINTSVPVAGDPGKEIESHTAFTLTRSKTSRTETKNNI